MFIIYIAAAVVSFYAPYARCASAATRSSAQRIITEEQREFSSFIDGFLAGVQKERAIPGMAFAAVRNGEILYLKGYGVRDVASGAPVLPEQTLFRVGSISKLMTATAIMQLIERGRISLDEDVNTYLRRWKLPERFGAPVTIRHLLTHTAGFDYKALEVCAPTSSDERSYGIRLQKIMPVRYAAPGKYYSNSNMGYSLIGSIIERYSRQDFSPAIKRHIFQPLGMNLSTFAPTQDERKNLAAGYDLNERVVPYEYRYDLPAMGMSTTASDMARFMMSALAGGVLGRNRILGDMYTRSMQRRHFSPHTLIEGAGLGYLEKHIMGWRTLQQSGNMNGYSSFLMLLPEKNFGFFFAANATDLDFYYEMASAIVGRFFPASDDKKITAATQPPMIRMDIEGYYRTNLISRHTAEKSARMTTDQLHVSIEDGAVVLKHTIEDAPPVRLIPMEVSDEGDLFIKAEDNGRPSLDYLFFQRNASGNVEAMIIGDVNHTYDKLQTHENHYWQIVFIVIFVSCAFLSFLGAILGSELNKRNPLWEKDLRSDTEQWNIASIFWLTQIAFVLGLIISIYFKGSEFQIFVPYQVKALFVIPLAGALLLAWFWFRIAGNILSTEHHWAEKLLLIIIASIETAYMFFLADWRLLGFMF
jgi:CubicO group peptidase (beta-lactamase class C family)